MANIRDVAKLAGVSVSTVSRVVNETAAVDRETKQRVVKAIEETGYKANTFARALKKGKTNTIAFLIPNMENAIYPTLAMTVENEAQKHGYFVLFCNTMENCERESEYIDKFKGTMADGFLVSTGLCCGKNTELLRMRDQGFPLMCLMREMDGPANSVVAKNEEGGYLGMKYLLERGFRDIAIIYGRFDLILYQQRLAGCIEAMKEYGLKLDEKMLLKGVTDGMEDGANCLQQFYDKYKRLPEAVFALSDPLAYSAMMTINSLGYSIPNNISLLGYDNAAFSASCRLSSIEQPLEAMARDATKTLIDMIEKRISPHCDQKVYPVRIVERDSVGWKDGLQPLDI